MTKISKIIKGVPSSFVFKNMKLDTDKGAGEAKLFVGSISQIEDINDFFKFDQEYSYRFDKSNLLNYLHEVKMEYVFQHVNKYKEASIETWQEFYTTVENMQDSEMQVHLTEFTDTSRVYVRANEEIFSKLFRKITVPKLTDVEFVRDDDAREIIILLKVNYGYDKETEDIKKYLAKELGGNPDDYNKIKIPDNMFIWATMNSADQGVFPMDTAFKRRWDFTYLGIDDNDQDLQGKYVYLADDKSQKVEWNKLRKAINNFLAKEKINEDKQLGPYFISRSIVVPKDSEEIDRGRFINTFKNKVIMYLFEDAAKQKRPRLFEGCFQNSSRYSEICREFEAKGIGIFNHDVQLDCEVEDVKSGEALQE